MLAALAAAGYSEPTPVQAGLIPRALAGVDVLGQARTGTGKTAAFTIPILEQLESGKKLGPQALVLVPTRELAVQVREEIVKLAHGRKTHSVALYGGKPIRGQIDKLRRGAEVVIGTPGRVLDHLARGTLELRDLKIVVLDEADRMLDIGFRPDIEKILRRCPQSRQTLLLSATVAPPVERLAQRYMRDPEMLNFSPKDVAVETIEQLYFTVDANRKFELLEKLLQREQPRQAIIFCRTKRGTEKIYQRLSKRLSDAATIHGDLPQGTRDRVMAGFRSGEVRYLVATDVVGRGIDVTNISHIINYDIPQFCDDYVHRVGRTGRMGREGVAYTFVTPEEGGELTRIEMRINLLLKRDDMPGISTVGKLADTSGIPAHAGPMQWTPGAGWGGGAEAPAGNDVKPDIASGDTAPSDDGPKEESPAPSSPGKKPGKRYRRAL
ncbi:MAG TPA: DEAD/DEAH box helicase [Pirellulales bacterium]|jgi:ATP-dependent RNA helicase DeaD